ncbi:MAG: hypothetical protein K0S76_2427 [Herbinix sp.]|nr:hypothetical protein [Herbinix sp.]
MKERVNHAIELFDQGFACSQSVLGAFCDQYGLDQNTALKIANGFGGGIARKQEVCGAVSGAVMTIGLQYGKKDASDSESHERTYQAVQCFCDEFTKRNNSILCSELLGCDMPTARERGLFHTSCRMYVQDAAEIVEELLNEG